MSKRSRGEVIASRTTRRYDTKTPRAQRRQQQEYKKQFNRRKKQ